MNVTEPSNVVALSNHREVAQLDIMDALDLLATAVIDRGDDFASTPNSGPNITNRHRYAIFDEPRCIVGYALSLANVTVEDLRSMRDQPVRDLYRDGGLPIPITLGALIVLDAAQRSQDRGRRWGDVLDDAVTAAAKFLDLVTVVRDITMTWTDDGIRRTVRPLMHRTPRWSIPRARSQP
jgi:hypothetical protein